MRLSNPAVYKRPSSLNAATVHALSSFSRSSSWTDARRRSRALPSASESLDSVSDSESVSEETRLRGRCFRDGFCPDTALAWWWCSGTASLLFVRRRPRPRDTSAAGTASLCLPVGATMTGVGELTRPNTVRQVSGETSMHAYDRPGHTTQCRRQRYFLRCGQHMAAQHSAHRCGQGAFPCATAPSCAGPTPR